MKKAPLVSVIIPNYNHASYLPQRIESVLAQTYQDFELIILDDCSTDHSRVIISQYAKQDERIQTIFNPTNSGSPFVQWNKGASLAEGEYIWIAESDDYADRRFLEKLVPRLDAHPEVGLAYCQSYNVDENSQIVSSRLDWTTDLDEDRWRKDFVNSGVHELQHYFLFKNTIPNASAVLLRKSVFLRVGGGCASMRLNGDKMTWTRILLVSDLAYCADHLNYFRSHTQNVRSITTYRNKLENFEWASFLSQHVAVPPSHQRSFNKLLMNEWKQTIFNKNYPHFLQSLGAFLNYGRKINGALYRMMGLYLIMGLPLIGAKLLYFALISRKSYNA